jgi:hypothetical protein
MGFSDVSLMYACSQYLYPDKDEKEIYVECLFGGDICGICFSFSAACAMSR